MCIRDRKWTAGLISSRPGTSTSRPALSETLSRLAVSSAGILTLNRLTVSGGLADADCPNPFPTICGGGIASRGMLTVKASRLIENTATGSVAGFGPLGGAVANAPEATVTLTNSEVSGNTVAPAIAQEQSEKHGWEVGRTSLKTRNPNNAPDAWEAAVLKQFEERAASGESPAEMAHFEVVEENGAKAFRFMKAIGMPPLDKAPCLKCHGENIDPAISAKLDELYPEDQARGYKPGMIRGAFTITQPME